MDYVGAIEQLEVEDPHSSSGKHIEEDPNEIAEVMEEDPEEIYRKEVKELRASRARSSTSGKFPEVPVGTTWSTRQDCYYDGVQRHMRAGAIVASGRYAHEDSGDTLIYTGAGKPVRVVRGYELGSEFAPIYGYRYDGLYTVKAAWKEKNKEGFYLCRYRMEASLPDNDQAFVTLTGVKEGSRSTAYTCSLK
ncbi:PUA-like domain-containing protein [Suillus subalutaceus]|uniref:PUA-like domain-containing protein n=1 Tax=Suillus subalutaceus TaxID=48586 RepID=UPI001B8742BC|nr:PUA-like domain-containing protein [Suillus subalutaceus]KAG1851604.1 PUA-like domain-containing protein [Suillus subalutaceus]